MFFSHASWTLGCIFLLYIALCLFNHSSEAFAFNFIIRWKGQEYLGKLGTNVVVITTSSSPRVTLASAGVTAGEATINQAFAINSYMTSLFQTTARQTCVW